MTQRHNYTALLLLLLAMGLTACTSFDPNAMRAMIKAQHPERDTVLRDAAAGYVTHQVHVLQPEEQIFVAHYDSAFRLRIDAGRYDSTVRTDTVLGLAQPDMIPPRTLHIAMRTIEGIYPTSQYSTFNKVDVGKTLLWTLLVLPAMTFSSMVMGMYIGDSMSTSSSWGVSPGAATGALVGALVGAFVWLVLTGVF